ncbi:hypothetical protein AgCh_004506 [Apium graveolens]
MGSSQSCNICSPDVSKDNVTVMKENGEAIEFKPGTKVYDVLASNPFHKVIRCCSDRTVLSENSTLNCNSLYFLLPHGLSISDATYRSLVNSAISKQLIVPKALRPANESNYNGTNVCTSNTTKPENLSSCLSSDSEISDEYICRKFAAWKPGLKAIPEVISPSPPISSSTCSEILKQQARDMDRADRPPDSWDPLSNSLVGTSSIRPERTGRALYGSAADYPAANNRSELTKGRVVQMYDDYSVPRGFCWLYAPREGERVPDGYGGCAVGISEAAFKCGLRVPPLKLIKNLFFQMGIALGQMDPNGFIHINCFQNRCLHAGIVPSTRLFWYHYDFRKNPKSAGFYTIARRAGRPDWTATNSNNKSTHTHWCYVSGPRLAAMSVWRDVNTALLLMPSLTLEEKENYTALVDVNCLQALIERKKARAGEKRAAEEAAKKASDRRVIPDPSEGTGERAQTERAPSPRQSHAASEAGEGDDLEYIGEGNPSKRTRSKEGIVHSYLPGWGVLTSDHTVYPARQSTKEVASDLCHGLQLPVDLPTFASASAIEACTELLSFLSLAAPWAAAVEDKVKDMETRMAEVKELERRAATAEEELVRVKARNEVEVAALKKDRSRLETELERANWRISHRNVQLKSLEDPIGRSAVEVPPVSSSEDEELSDEDPQA